MLSRGLSSAPSATPRETFTFLCCVCVFVFCFAGLFFLFFLATSKVSFAATPLPSSSSSPPLPPLCCCCCSPFTGSLLSILPRRDRDGNARWDFSIRETSIGNNTNPFYSKQGEPGLARCLVLTRFNLTLYGLVHSLGEPAASPCFLFFIPLSDLSTATSGLGTLDDNPLENTPTGFP